VYRDDGFLHRLNRVLSWSFPVGRWLGSEIRIYGMYAIVPLIAAAELWGIPGISGAEALAYGAQWGVLLGLVVLTHELGHAWMARRYHIPTPRITLSPLGGLAHLQSAAPSPGADVRISLAGPAVHLLWLAVAWPLSKVLPPVVWRPSGFAFVEPVSGSVDLLVYVNVALALFNLLPFFPMDGGRVFRSLLAYRMHPNRASLWAAWVGMAGAIAFVVVGFARGRYEGGILIAIGVTNFLMCQRERLGALYGEGPYGIPREPWESDPDAWRRGASDVLDSRPGFWRRLKAKWSRSERPVGRFETAPDDAELDRLLAKVGEVGITGLSRSERAALQRASEARRR
jgi:Zn-dependent protease